MKKLILFLLTIGLMIACHKDNTSKNSSTTQSAPVVYCRFYKQGANNYPYYIWVKLNCDAIQQNNAQMTNYTDGISRATTGCDKCDSILATLH